MLGYPLWYRLWEKTICGAVNHLFLSIRKAQVNKQAESMERKGVAEEKLIPVGKSRLGRKE